MIDANALLDHAEDIFFELAVENMSEQTLARIQTHPDALYLEVHERFSGNWEELLYEEVQSDEYVELGVYFELEGKAERLALFLMSLDSKECHIQW